MNYSRPFIGITFSLLLSSTTLVGPVGAQSDPTDTTIQESTTTTTTEQSTTVNEATTTTTNTETDAAIDDATSSTLEIIDLLVDEVPGELPPESEATVPPPETYDQLVYEPPEILWSNVNAAKTKYDAALKEYSESIQVVRSLRKSRKKYDVQIQALDSTSKSLIKESAAIEDSIEKRAVVDFMIHSRGEELSPIGSGATVTEQMEKYSMDSILKIDYSEIESHQVLKKKLGEEINLLLAKQKDIKVVVAEAEKVALEFRVDSDQAQIEYEAFKAGSEVYVQGVVFPIAGEYVNPLFDSYGFPRMPNTPDSHWHEGIDIFAPRGTPLVAAERGVLTSVGSNRLGGLKIWLRGESGVEWYYAHLQAFAPGITQGQVVDAGTLIGFVGDSGNAVGTPPHLHLEMHPGGGKPVNPYPLLNMVAKTEQDYIQKGIHQGYKYESLQLQ